jgi:UDP-glucuronate 4-epimerase
MTKVLVTGSAGFIGFHLTKALLKLGFHVTGIDNLNDYYDPQLKSNRLDALDKFISDNDLLNHYLFVRLDLNDEAGLRELFAISGFNIVINLAAQAGVRYSLKNPKAYVDSNLVGFMNLLECCRKVELAHFIFASSSSVYGMNNEQPFSASHNTDYPVSLYAASKKCNELLAHSYSHLFKIPCTGLRFFTVYGPYGRPDMAYYSFTESINNGKSIDVYNNGDMERDFTYIDDIIDGILMVLKAPPLPHSPLTSNAVAAFEVLNIGNNKPVTLNEFICCIESALGKKAMKNNLPMQPGDMPITFADITPIAEKNGFNPTTSIEDGMKKFVDWYLSQGL